MYTESYVNGSVNNAYGKEVRIARQEEENVTPWLGTQTVFSRLTVICYSNIE